MENLFQITLPRQQIDAISNLGLAHMGDGVWELLCRSYLCAQGEKTVGQLHRDTIAMVKAPAQAAYAEKLLPLLTEQELAQLNDYHRRVYDTVSPLLPAEEQAWLAQATAPLCRS